MWFCSMCRMRVIVLCLLLVRVMKVDRLLVMKCGFFLMLERFVVYLWSLWLGVVFLKNCFFEEVVMVCWLMFEVVIVMNGCFVGVESVVDLLFDGIVFDLCCVCDG